MESGNSAWVPGTYKPPPGATNDVGDLLGAMRAFGEAFTSRQAGEIRRGHELMEQAQAVLGSAGIRLVLALLKAGRIPYPDAPWWPVFLSELVRHDPDEPLYVSLPAAQPRPAAPPSPPMSLADEWRSWGLCRPSPAHVQPAHRSYIDTYVSIMGEWEHGTDQAGCDYQPAACHRS